MSALFHIQRHTDLRVRIGDLASQHDLNRQAFQQASDFPHRPPDSGAE